MIRRRQAAAVSGWHRVRVVTVAIMTHRRHRQRDALANAVLAVLLGGALIGAGCSKESTPPRAEGAKAGEPGMAKSPAEVTPAAVAPSGDEDEAAEASALAKARFDEANFDLSIKPKGSYKSGQAGSVEIVLDAKKPFHVNDKYPYKLKLAKAEGLKFASQVVKKEAVKLEPQRAVMTVDFTPESTGKRRVAGQFSFSVCTDDKCLIEKRDLALEIQVD